MKTSLQVQRVQADDSALPPVYVTYIAHRKTWILLADYLLERPQDESIFVNIGLEFDLASIPRPIWTLISPFELSIVAPLIHDFLYVWKGKPPGHRTYTRKEADGIFLELMKLERVPAWKCKAAHLAVRWFGPRW